MIKALGITGEGTPLVILGLSGENVTRLVASEPILINLAELGLPPLQLSIVYGKTEEDIVAKLTAAGVVDADTERVGP